MTGSAFINPDIGIIADVRVGHETGKPQSEQIESASLIGRFGSSTFRPSTTGVLMSLAGSRFSSESALRPFHHGIRGRGGTIFAAALSRDGRQVQADSRTHLIHRPARDIIPPSAELEFAPTGLNPTRLSCFCCGLCSAPAELGAIDPDTVHDHGQPSCQGNDGLFHAAALGDLHRPGFEP